MASPRAIPSEEIEPWACRVGSAIGAARLAYSLPMIGRSAGSTTIRAYSTPPQSRPWRRNAYFIQRKGVTEGFTEVFTACLRMFGSGDNQLRSDRWT
jgi:hypothetical protein